jgi:hypothetical protein
MPLQHLPGTQPSSADVQVACYIGATTVSAVEYVQMPGYPHALICQAAANFRVAVAATLHASRQRANPRAFAAMRAAALAFLWRSEVAHTTAVAAGYLEASRHQDQPQPLLREASAATWSV